MGLFSFIKSAGAKVAGMVGIGGDEPAQQEAAPMSDVDFALGLAKAVRDHNLAIEDLAVRFSDGTATVLGTATATAAAEKAILIVGNHEGVGAVDDQIVVNEPEPPSVYRTVVSGDTLSKISLEVYGVIHLYDKIFESNQPMLNHPDEIFPGQVLRCPPVEAPVYTVERGDSLGKIAKHWYGDAKRYTDIFEANQGTLTSPDAIEVGQQLTIPLSADAPALA
ncbi:MAG: peptidoglycan-binding protein LysM [Proteobacteria bacterium]|nr:peptidoglycan-binding protein LysM [Pseudomonadota bacterium]